MHPDYTEVLESLKCLGGSSGVLLSNLLLQVGLQLTLDNGCVTSLDLGLKASKDGDLMASLGSLWQGCTAAIVKQVFLMSRQNV